MRLKFADDPVEEVADINSLITHNLNNFYNFVSFSKYTGDIKYIGTTKKFYNDESVLCKKFYSEKFKDILLGNKSENKLKIIFDNKYKVIEREKTKKIFNIDKNLGGITFDYIKTVKNEIDYYDLKVYTFSSNDKLRIYLNPVLRSNFKKLANDIETQIWFANKNDPNLFYHTIPIKINDLIVNDFLEFDIKKIKDRVSLKNLILYTKKFLANYKAYIVDNYEEIGESDSQTFNIFKVTKEEDNYNILLKYNDLEEEISIDILEKNNIFNSMINKEIKLLIFDKFIEIPLDKITFKIPEDYNKFTFIIKQKIKCDIENAIILHSNPYLKIKYENTYN